MGFLEFDNNYEYHTDLISGNNKFTKFLIVKYGNCLVQWTPQSMQKKTSSGKPDYTYILGVLKKKLECLREEGWSDEKIKTIIIKMCEDNAPTPLRKGVLEEYESLYDLGMLGDIDE